MAHSSQILVNRQRSNRQALTAFGLAPANTSAHPCRIVRSGNKITIFTIGYEQRDGESLISALVDNGVNYLADIRERPMSRKPDFRASALRGYCESASIQYENWPTLGSTESQREKLHETGNFSAFERSFRKHAVKNMSDPIDKLSRIAKKKVVALLCYERSHDECHRGVVSEMLADRLDASIAAIL
ncbi:MAG: DUF488 family protein [Phycisphaerales bacterium]